MLTIQGSNNHKFCDGVSRRDFLKIGGLALGGMSLADVLAAEAQAGIKPNGNSHKAIIMIFLAGGAPHQDMFDMKPNAPAEVRGEFKPMATNVSGIEICELMPKLAKMMDKTAIIRSLVGASGEHTANICMSGYTQGETAQKHLPALGSAVSRLQGQVDPNVPAFVGLSPKMGHMPWADPGQPGFLGLAHSAFQPDGQVMQDMTLKGMSLSRLADRKRLLSSVDHFRKGVDSNLGAADAITQRAFSVLSSSKLLQALDVEREDPKIRDKYGRGSLKNVDDGGPMWNDGFVVARRLVEAGVRCVTLGYGRWDYHGNNFGQCRERLPILDQGLSALIQDLHDRGLGKDVQVVVWGEMGRTPTINRDGGRDHWHQVSSALLAGGGIKTGQVLGSTTPDAGYAADRPIHYRDVFATLYRNLGIDVETMPVPDATGRPIYLLEGHRPVSELI